MTNVIVADHEPIFRTGIAKLLAAEDDIRIIAQPDSVDRLINAVKGLRPHVLVMSSGFLPLLTDIHKLALAGVKRQIAIMILSAKTEDMWKFFPFGVQSVLSRSSSGDVLIKGVRELGRGGFYLPADGTGKSGAEVRQRVVSKLSRRDLKIITNVVQGYKNREIAVRLGTSEQMIKNAMVAIYDKTGVSDRLELALFVAHHHVLPQGLLQKARNVPLLPVAREKQC
jgi:DNA-binding NarL/FixJ family response regulator